MMNQRLLWQAEACTHCLECAESCPVSALKFENLRLTGVDAKACVLCGRCVLDCPEEALAIR